MDDLSFERIINVPKRSIGDTTIKLISEFAKKQMHFRNCIKKIN